MLGTEITSHSRRWTSILFLAVLILSAGIILIFYGPIWSVWAFSLGVVLTLLTFFFRVRFKGPLPPLWSLVLLLVINLIGIGISTALKNTFLGSGDEITFPLPRLIRLYEDPSGLFTLRGPDHWSYALKISSTDHGVTLRPTLQANYTGSTEISVSVRKLEVSPLSVKDFLEQMAIAFKRPERKMKQETTEFKMTHKLIELIDGSPALISILDIRRRWIPFRQIAIFSLKNKKYLCTVTVTGIKKHAHLSKEFCLGLSESLEIIGESK